MSDGRLVAEVTFDDLTVPSPDVPFFPPPDSVLSPRSTKTLSSAWAALGPLLEGYPPDASACAEASVAKSHGTPVFKWRKLLSLSSGKSKEFDAKARDMEVRLLLQSLGAPLAAVPKQVSLPRPTTPELTQGQRRTREVMKRFIAATGGYGLHNSSQSSCISGQVTMWVSEAAGAGVAKSRHSFRSSSSSSSSTSSPSSSFNSTTTVSNSSATQGSFSLWQMPPGSWYVEVALDETKVHAGCDGSAVWRQNWTGYYPAVGPVRPLRRAIEGLDPPGIASMFNVGEFGGEEENVAGEECAAVKITANPLALMAMSSGGGGGGGESAWGAMGTGAKPPAADDMCDVLLFEMVGFFSKRSGLMVGLKDRQLTKSKNADGDVVYWERVMVTRLDDFRKVEGGITVPHRGRSALSLCRSSDDNCVSPMRVSMHELWTVDEVVFNRAGLMPAQFAPPPEMQAQEVQGKHF